MVGVVGFEPTDGRFRVSCLTTWRHSRMMHLVRNESRVSCDTDSESPALPLGEFPICIARGIVSKGSNFANFFENKKIPSRNRWDFSIVILEVYRDRCCVDWLLERIDPCSDHEGHHEKWDHVTTTGEVLTRWGKVIFHICIGKRYKVNID